MITGAGEYRVSTDGVRQLLYDVIFVFTLQFVILCSGFQLDNLVNRRLEEYLINPLVIITFPVPVQRIADVGAGHDVIYPGYQPYNLPIRPQSPAEDLKTEEFIGAGVVRIKHLKPVKLGGQTDKTLFVEGREGLTGEDVHDIIHVVACD